MKVGVPSRLHLSTIASNLDIRYMCNNIKWEVCPPKRITVLEFANSILYIKTIYKGKIATSYPNDLPHIVKAISRLYINNFQGRVGCILPKKIKQTSSNKYNIYK